MNIFVLHPNAEIAARMHCDKHVPKMCVEAAQMMASALRRHGATDTQMPLTKAGTPYKGGYAHHPCTVWAGEIQSNFTWLSVHARALCKEYRKRFGKMHACEFPIMVMSSMKKRIPVGKRTPFAQAMPDEYHVEYRHPENITNCDNDAVQAYRRYYHSKQFAKWEKGTPAPDWWRGVEVKA
tara:strand:- start:917 stop:1459 length:543 start_codon:yes stop_codon:yes gene_type:complete